MFPGYYNYKQTNYLLKQNRNSLFYFSELYRLDWQSRLLKYIFDNLV